jgi:hypothetical protein
MAETCTTSEPVVEERERYAVEGSCDLDGLPEIDDPFLLAGRRVR